MTFRTRLSASGVTPTRTRMVAGAIDFEGVTTIVRRSPAPSPPPAVPTRRRNVTAANRIRCFIMSPPVLVHALRMETNCKT